MEIKDVNQIKVGDKIEVVKDANISSSVTAIIGGQVIVDYNGHDNHIPMWQLQVHVDCGTFRITRG